MASKKIYWDSCVFIHLLQETNYVDALREVVHRAKNGECKIVTSAVSLAEVCKLPELGALPEDQTTKILQFFQNDYIDVYQADRFVCEEAHRIIRKHGLKPMDAIHMATASIAKVDLVMTSETKKYRRGGLLRCDGLIGNPPLKVSLPDLGVFLPLLKA
jgi:predicted nucleic acid-binding protein